jgi:nicotinamidase-related amidase
MGFFKLYRERVGLLVIDMQDKILNSTERLQETVERAQLVIGSMQKMGIPILATEQNPTKLGATTPSIKYYLETPPIEKMAFSCYEEASCRDAIDDTGCNQWILIGVETHVCVLQTAKDLISTGHEVVILNDATTSRSIFDYSTAIAEMRDMGARISSTEIVLFELLGTCTDPSFKEICGAIKGCGSKNCCQG